MCLESKGFSQVPGIDFQKVYYPVSCYATVRLVFTLAVLLFGKLELMDVTNAFVNADLTKNVCG